MWTAFQSFILWDNNIDDDDDDDDNDNNDYKTVCKSLSLGPMCNYDNILF